MGGSTPGPHAGAAPQLWRIGRASLGFLVDTFSMSRGGAGDIVDPLLLTVIVDSNLAPFNQDPELTARYATLDDPPPDELRRPVSVNAIAASLRMPYETVRRRVTRLIELGAVQATPKGVVVPAGTLHNPFYDIVATARYERMKRLYFEIKALGGLAGLDVRPPEAPRHERAPVRLANRQLSEYSLRVIDGFMRRLGDPVTGLILLEMAHANAEHLSASETAYEGPMSDDKRRPIRALTLAKRVGLPPETVRRHVAKLEQHGFCRKVEGGLLAALEQLGQGGSGEHGLMNNLTNLHRMLVRLAALGVLAFWDDEAATACAAG